MEILFLLLFFIVAFLYASVGHGGASGYLALMILMGLSPALMKSSALIMNLAVSIISFVGFYRAGYFRLTLFLPFVALSIPMAFWGGTLVLTDDLYKKILASCLLFAIVRMFYSFEEQKTTKKSSLWASLVLGGAIGFISGLIGIGGGILLSPLILMMRWASIKETAAISSLFIFVNSFSGLIGQLQKGTLQLTDNIQYFVISTLIGGVLGSYFGSQKFNFQTLKYLLAIGLIIASMKLFFC